MGAIDLQLLGLLCDPRLLPSLYIHIDCIANGATISATTSKALQLL